MSRQESSSTAEEWQPAYVGFSGDGIAYVGIALARPLSDTFWAQTFEEFEQSAVPYSRLYPAWESLNKVASSCPKHVWEQVTCDDRRACRALATQFMSDLIERVSVTSLAPSWPLNNKARGHLINTEILTDLPDFEKATSGISEVSRDQPTVAIVMKDEDDYSKGVESVSLVASGRVKRGRTEEVLTSSFARDWGGRLQQSGQLTDHLMKLSTGAESKDESQRAISQAAKGDMDRFVRWYSPWNDRKRTYFSIVSDKPAMRNLVEPSWSERCEADVLGKPRLSVRLKYT